MMVTEATNPAIVIERDGVFYVEIMLTPELGPKHPGHVVYASIGDGREFARRVLDLIVLPAIAPRPLDPEVHA